MNQHTTVTSRSSAPSPGPDGAVGVFDSGLGGLTAVKELMELLPDENIVYFGDTARIPYGTRSRETILKYTEQDISFLRQHNVKMIIAACGTVSSVLGIKPYDCGLPFTGVLLPAAQAACGATRTGRIGVIGTSATIRSGSFGKAIRTIRPDAFVAGNSCPLLVPLVENGHLHDQLARLALEQYLAPILAERIDTLILGCTHYPLLEPLIRELVGEDIALISSGREAAKVAAALLTARELFREPKDGQPASREFYVSDSVEMFTESASIFLEQPLMGNVRMVSVP